MIQKNRTEKMIQLICKQCGAKEVLVIDNMIGFLPLQYSVCKMCGHEFDWDHPQIQIRRHAQ